MTSIACSRGGGIAPCSNADGSDKVTHIPVKISNELIGLINMEIDKDNLQPFSYDGYNDTFKDNGYTPTLTQNCSRVSNRGGQGVCIPVLTPDREEKRQNGRRFKENGDPEFTLTAQDIHGVALDTSCNQGVVVAIDVDSKDEEHPGLYIKLAEDFIIYAVWYEKYKCYITVRKLTPKECFRLQGWSDDYFEKAEFVNSNSQLYKQAGNGITVNVTEAIGKML